MDQAKKDELIENFCSVSGVEKERAQFYLESANWDLPVALSEFFESGTGGEEAEEAAAIQESLMSTDPPPVQSQQPGISAASESSRDVLQSKNTSSGQPSRGRRNFASIHDYKDKPSNDDSDSDEEGQRFYAGGSEHSGNMIVGPKRKGLTNDAITSKLFAQAKKHGAETVESSESEKEEKKAFQGSGYRLGESGTSSEVIRSVPETQRPTHAVIKFWKNGFSVNDGELRSFNDPQHAEFLNSVQQGQVPQELVQQAHGGKVGVNLEDHRNEEYKYVKPKMVPFSGQGHALGSTPSDVDMSQASSSQASAEADSVKIDEAKPKTTLQIRLKDGSRVRREFNHSHTVGDLHAVVASASSTANFVLMTTFPNRQLTDEKQTLAEANLLNAMVVQKML